MGRPAIRADDPIEARIAQIKGNFRVRTMPARHGAGDGRPPP